MTEQRVAVVTGASRGVGKGIALALGAAGHVVYVTGRSAGTQVTFPAVGGTVDETARTVTAAGGTGVAVACDHTDDGQTAALFERVRAEQGGLDLLVNNVWGGYAAYHEDRHTDMEGPFWEQPLRVWDDMFTSGVRAHYAATVLAVPVLRPGALVVTVSFFPGSYLNGDDQVAYSVAKAADDSPIWTAPAPRPSARTSRSAARPTLFQLGSRCHARSRRSSGSRRKSSGRPRIPLRADSCDSARPGPVPASTPARQRSGFQRMWPSQPPIRNTNQLGPGGGTVPPPAA